MRDASVLRLTVDRCEWVELAALRFICDTTLRIRTVVLRIAFGGVGTAVCHDIFNTWYAVVLAGKAKLRGRITRI